jgi:hypothetical protein
VSESSVNVPIYTKNTLGTEDTETGRLSVSLLMKIICGFKNTGVKGTHAAVSF